MTTSSPTPRLDAIVTALATLTGVRHTTNHGFDIQGLKNDPGQNTKSLTILVFAKYAGLSIAQTLPLFCEAYEDVLRRPWGDDHKNIRMLMTLQKERIGLEGVHIEGQHEGISFRKELDALWENRANINPSSDDSVRKPIEEALRLLDTGVCRVAFKLDDYGWYTDQAMKKAVLLYFRLSDNVAMHAGDLGFYDKVPTKFASLSEEGLRQSGVRVVPPAVARYGSFVQKGAILMPSYVNIGAYVDEGTMVDTWATVGSCAQIGKGVHLSGGVGIGGVLEPLQANPTIIENGCFIGARSEVVEGVIVRERAVLSMGTFIGKNTPIVDRTKGDEVIRGEVPAGAVVMMGLHPESGLLCPQIVKYRDGQTDAATALNELLRN